MYETLEHWNQYKQLKNNLKDLKYLELAMAKHELDLFLNKLIAKNGTTNY